MPLSREENLEKKRLQSQQKRRTCLEKKQKELERCRIKNINRSKLGSSLLTTSNVYLNTRSENKQSATPLTDAKNASLSDVSDSNDIGKKNKHIQPSVSSTNSSIDENFDFQVNKIDTVCPEFTVDSDSDFVQNIDASNSSALDVGSNLTTSNDFTKSARIVSNDSVISKLSRSLRFVKNREAKMRREIQKLKLTIESKNVKIKLLHNQIYKLKKKANKVEKDLVIKSVNKIEAKGKKAVRASLIYGEVMRQQILSRSSSFVDHKSKSFLARLVSGKIVKKYKFMKKNNSLVSEYLQRKHMKMTGSNSYRQTKKVDEHRKLVEKDVTNFLERDDNSSMAPGAKDTITKNGICKRKRYLCDTKFNLYKKYCKEGLTKICKSTFYNLFPFWILTKMPTNRDTCLCKIHANIDLLVKKLALLKLLPVNNTQTLIEKIKCDITNKKCMYNECTKCNKDCLPPTNSNEKTFYYKWATHKETRPGKGGKMFNVIITSKQKIECTVSELVQQFNLNFAIFLKHSYDTSHQYAAVQEIERNLKANEAKVVIDFSQNYISKYASEIQSVHFGASKTQFTLHSGVFYYRNENDKNVTCVSFCTASESLRHDAPAVWAHLKPILSLIREKVPQLHTIHFQSDGPTTQYKNKTNFDLFQHHCKKMGLKKATWNITTPGHGKSSADGSGGTAKTLCDRAVHAGRDVISIKDIIDVVSKSKIKIFHVTLADIEEIDKLVRANTKSAPKSQQIFQIMWIQNKSHLLFLNQLSCNDINCLSNPPCKHYSLIPDGWAVESIQKPPANNTRSKKSTSINTKKQTVLKSNPKKRKVEVQTDDKDQIKTKKIKLSKVATSMKKKRNSSFGSQF